MRFLLLSLILLTACQASEQPAPIVVKKKAASEADSGKSVRMPSDKPANQNTDDDQNNSENNDDVDVQYYATQLFL